MRRHWASSERSTAGKPRGFESKPRSGRFRFAILAATVAAFLLVSVAQAAASQTVKVNITGTGAGEVVSGAEGGAYKGTPQIVCTYSPKAGTCENKMSDEGEGYEATFLTAKPKAGSKFVKWTVKGGEFEGCGTFTGCLPYVEPAGGSGTTEVTAEFASEPKPKQELIVNITGTGAGEVVSGAEGGAYKGTPQIVCTYSPKAGTCKNVMSDEGEGYEATFLTAKAKAGSKFVKWTVQKGEFEGCGAFTGCLMYVEPPGTGSGVSEVTAEFASEPTTNLRTLTLTKSPSSSTGGGNGSVSSKPKGIKCGAACDEAVASMYKNSTVELKAKASTGSTLVSWTGCDSSTNTGLEGTCTVAMTAAKNVKVTFGGTSKVFSPAEKLTVSKEGTGKGTVKGPGLGCEAECTSTVVLFQGPITEPKAKAGKVVVLKQAPAFGSTFAGWSGCESEPEGNCQVAMETAKKVTAKYTALPNKVLTVNKEYAKGNGSVSSKPKGIKCGTTCTQAVAQMPEGAAVELIAKPTTGTFVKWEGGDCNGKTETTCVVTMNTNETTKAVFSDPGKAFSPAETLTVEKAGKGFGTVKAAGLGCEVLCSSTSVIYQGPITEPKAKPGKIVILKAVSAPGSKAVSWSGCDSLDEEGNCVVTMETSRKVTATFGELE